MPSRIILQTSLLPAGMLVRCYIADDKSQELSNRAAHFHPNGKVIDEAEIHAHAVFSQKPDEPLRFANGVQQACSYIVRINGVRAVGVYPNEILVLVGVGFLWEKDGIRQSVIAAISGNLGLVNPEIMTLQEWQSANGFASEPSEDHGEILSVVSTAGFGGPSVSRN